MRPDRQSRPGWASQAASQSFRGDTQHGSTQKSPPWEPTAWLRDLIARRQADVAHITTATCDVAIAPASYDVEPGSREDRSCDRCGVYVPPSLRLHMGAAEARRSDGLRLLVPFGLCRRCMDAELVA